MLGRPFTYSSDTTAQCPVVLKLIDPCHPKCTTNLLSVARDDRV